MTIKKTRKFEITLFLVFLKIFGSPKGNRTLDSTVRGWRLNRLTIGPYMYNNIFIKKNQDFLRIIQIILY